MHGFLTKRVDSQKVGRRRWFLLGDKNLYMFRDETRREMLGSLDLRQLTSVTVADGGLGFALRFPTMTYHLEASNPEEVAKWVRVIRETAVFGVPLEILSRRRRGPSEKGVPLVLVKCLAFLVAHCNEAERLFEEDGDPRMVQRLRLLFDQDDLSMNLNSLTTTATEVASVAQLIKVFLSELPDAVVPEVVAQNLVQVARIEDPSFLMMGCEELLKQLPEWSTRTLKKVLVSLNTIIEKGADVYSRREAFARLFAPLLFRLPQAADPGLQVTMLSYLIRVASTIFKGVIADDAPRKPARPHANTALPAADRAPPSAPGGTRHSAIAGTYSDILESVNIVEVTVDDGPQTLTFPVSPSTSVKELKYNLVKKLVSSTPSNLCTNYSLFEVTPEYGEHILFIYLFIIILIIILLDIFLSLSDTKFGMQRGLLRTRKRCGR